MNFKENLQNIWKKVVNFIDKGIIQRVFRISYDVIWNLILFFIVIGVLGFFFISGLGAGYFASLVKDEPLRSSESMVDSIYNYEETSEIYFSDNVYLGKVSSDLHREVIPIDEVSEYIINGIIATEDEYFKTHNGIVPKAIMRAVFQEVVGSNIQTGGSTLTQQIIKNQILTNEVSFDRKAKEIVLAMRLENFMEKDEILEAYLNIVPFGRNANGRNISGIQTAAEGIFGLNADEVNIAQAAFLAGLPQSPIAYSPFTNTGTVKSEEGLAPGLSRMQTVLSRMHQAEYITEAEYNEALEFNIVESLAERSPTLYDEYPYLSEVVRSDVEDIFKETLALEDGYTLEELESNQELNEQYRIYAARELSQGGYNIHTTIDKEIYDAFQEVTAAYDNFGQDKTATVTENKQTRTIMTEDPETGKLIPLVQQQQVGAVLRENDTGKIIAFVAGRDFERDNVNFAIGTRRRQLGSTAKPIAVYGPAFEEGTLQPGSILPDAAFTNIDAAGNVWKPRNFVANRYYGLVTARTAMTQSYNVSTAAAYLDLLKEHNPVPKYLAKMGFDHIPESNYGYGSIALGAFEGTVEENTSAFSTFGNGGQYVEGYMIDRIETVDGELVYQHKVEPVEVFSPETSYLIMDIMRDVLSSGTARTARNNLTNRNVDWGGKTGTSNELVDAWIVGVNPNVTLGSWMGYGYRQSLDSGYSSRNQAYWARLVNRATEINPDLMAPSEPFNRPNNIVSQRHSVVSGLKPSALTESLGLVRTDLFNVAYLPEKEDYSLVEGSYVLVNGQAALPGDSTPGEFVQGDGVMFNPEWLSDTGYDKLENINQLIPSNNSTWSGIEFPELGGEKIKDTGSKPNPPTSLSISGSTLSWNKPTSNNVIGYRVYRAAEPDSDFSLLESSINSELNVGGNDAVYQVTSVDYFGRESDRSKSFVFGDFSDDEEDEVEDIIENENGDGSESESEEDINADSEEDNESEENIEEE